MPFGLHNTGSTFKRMIDHVFAGLPFIFVSLDDVLVASPDHASHRCFARCFSRLCENGLTINTLKSIFSKEEVKILDLQVLASGLSLATCRLFRYPSTRLELQRFLGLVSFYHWFLRGAVGLLLP